MKKIMILGSSGMLGHIVYYYLKSLNKYNILDASFHVKLHEKTKLLDVTKASEVEQYITTEKPDVIINCIGILIKGSSSDPSNAIYINSYFPHQLSKIIRKTEGRLIHISTDCVFSGKKGEYNENDFRDADDIYGRSKALGEIINEFDTTLRTSIIGPELKQNGEGLFHWFIKQKGEIKGFTKAFWGGVTTLELAKAIEAVIQQNITGLIHVTNGQSISKFEMISLFKEIWNKNDIAISEVEGKNADKSLKSVRSDFNYSVPSYKEMFMEQFDWMQVHNDLYKQYQS